MLLNVSPDVQQGMCQGGKTKRIRAREETRNEKGLNICTQSSLSILVTINRLNMRMNNNVEVKGAGGFYSALSWKLYMYYILSKYVDTHSLRMILENSSITCVAIGNGVMTQWLSPIGLNVIILSIICSPRL